MKDKLLHKVHDICIIIDNESSTAYKAVLLLNRDLHKFVDKFIEMDKSDIDDETLDIAKIIIVAAKEVYENHQYTESFDDNTYDKLLMKYKKFRPEPFSGNGIGLANAKYKYDTLSGTLNKVHFIHESERNELDPRESLEKYIMNLPCGRNDIIHILINEKKDGTSVTIDYKFDGVDSYIPQSAISRGKKDYGEGTDVSAVIPEDFNPQIHDLAINTFGYYPEYIGVQYEFLVSNNQKKEFEQYAKQKFANNRSAAAGLLRRIVFAKPDERRILHKFMSLCPVGFDVLDEYRDPAIDKEVGWASQYLSVLSNFGYGEVDMNCSVHVGTKAGLLKDFEKESKHTLSMRKNLNHAIDGMVVTILDPDLRETLGRKNNINQFQIAYKFPEEGEKTVVRDFEITTGMFGYKEMLLIVDPVVLNGTTQFKGQVYSIDNFNKMRYRIGDEVVMKLSGDVIPHLYRTDDCKRGDGELIKFPERCECGAPLVEEKNRYRCSNPKCPFRVIGTFYTFFVELNAKGIGLKTCEQLYHELGIRKISEILELTKADFMKLKGFKDASAEACMKTIENVKTVPRAFPNILSSIGIDTLRASTAEKILGRMSPDELIRLVKNSNLAVIERELKKCSGIADNAKKLAEGLKANIDELLSILGYIQVKEPEKKFDRNILISGMRNDPMILKVAKEAGFNVKDSGTKYDILVIRDSTMMTASKAQAALKNGKPIMTKDEFIRKYESING